jgi:hypothetical protein
VSERVDALLPSLALTLSEKAMPFVMIVRSGLLEKYLGSMAGLARGSLLVM